MKILFVAGGSGGHIIPALAVADTIRVQFPTTQIVFVSSRHSIDAAVFAAHGYQYRREMISTGKWRRYFSWQNFLDPFRFVAGIFESLKLLKKERPNVIFSKGGFVALPVGIAAKLRRIPLVIHESDSVSGLTNRLLKKLAAQVLTTFPDAHGIWVGTPIRPEVFSGDAAKGRAFLGFSTGAPILLVTGGSQGAETLNQLLLHSLDVLQKTCCVVHLSGVGKSAAQDGPHYRAFPYLGAEFSDVLAASDAVICRAGANTLFEIAAAKKPALLIPLPSAANDHQRQNAEFFAKADAARVLPEPGLTSAFFQKTVLDFLGDEAALRTLGANAGKLARPDAARRIAEILMHFDS